MGPLRQGPAELRERLDWDSDGGDWPNRESSHFVHAAGLVWHVQQFLAAGDDAPLVLLLHGTGSSSHSWRDVAPLLAQHYRVLVPDLPGHAFTGMPSPSSEQSLPGMARRVGQLLEALQMPPSLIVGHSAGAAVGTRMVLDGSVRPAALVSLNGAFIGFGGLAGALFSPLAKLLATGTMAARLFARQAQNPEFVRRLMRGTGSVLDDTGMRLYARLMQCPAHVRAALAMMAHWDLGTFSYELRRLSLPVWLVGAENDMTVPVAQLAQVAALLPHAEQVRWPVLGHLAHEEGPTQCVTLLRQVLHTVATR